MQDDDFMILCSDGYFILAICMCFYEMIPICMFL